MASTGETGVEGVIAGVDKNTISATVLGPARPSSSPKAPTDE
jgi:hypothetical protein